MLYIVSPCIFHFLHENTTGSMMDIELHSPFFNASSYGAAYLSFKGFVYSDSQLNEAEVGIRCSNDGWLWQKLWDRNGMHNYQADRPLIDITQYTSTSSGCQIIFRCSGADDPYWQIDDVAVQGVLSQAGFEGSSYELPHNQWRLISLPREPESGNTTVSNLFSDDFPAKEYWNDWILYKRNTGTTTYAELQLASPLEMGKGYWIYSNNAATLDVPGLPAGSDNRATHTRTDESEYQKGKLAGDSITHCGFSRSAGREEKMQRNTVYQASFRGTR